MCTLLPALISSRRPAVSETQRKYREQYVEERELRRLVEGRREARVSAPTGSSHGGTLQTALLFSRGAAAREGLATPMAAWSKAESFSWASLQWLEAPAPLVRRRLPSLAHGLAGGIKHGAASAAGAGTGLAVSASAPSCRCELQLLDLALILQTHLIFRVHERTLSAAQLCARSMVSCHVWLCGCGCGC